MQFSIRWVPFACIIKMQFENLRDGDRFFFSNGVEDATCLKGPILLLRGRSDKGARGRYSATTSSQLQSSLFPSSIGREIFRTLDWRTNPQMDCMKLAPGTGTLYLNRIFEEAIAEPGYVLNFD